MQQFSHFSLFGGYGNGTGRAGLEVPDGAKLMISSSDGDGEITGQLEAWGGKYGSGIGGPGLTYSSQGRAGFINIVGGTIEAHGSYGGAGIGGGNTNGFDGGGEILIQGGKITAWGANDGTGGPGIGSGFYPTYPNHNYAYTSDNTSIIIEAVESLTAYGGDRSAGIGGAYASSAGTIKINKKLIDENRITAVAGGTGAEPIGWGEYGSQIEDNDIDLDTWEDYFYTYDVPDRPTTEVEVKTAETKYVYEEITTPVTKEVTREVVKKVDKIIGERVVDTMPVIKGLDGDFVFHEKNLDSISQFHDASGKFLASQPKIITITQGDGKTASVALYEHDTMQDVAKKINDTIANSLGQAQYSDNIEKFCTIADGTDNTSEAAYKKEPIYSEEGYLSEYGFDIPVGTLIGYKVSSTMLVRSALPGKAGELYFSGDEDLLNALGLNTIQESQEAEFMASVYDAHSGAPVAINVKSSAPEFKSLIPPEIDIEVDAMAGLSANWDENTKQFITARKEVYSAYLHLKNNGTVFQVGANEGEDFIVQLGDSSSNALGISAVNVLTRETASHAISTIDNAINKISSQRAKIGAYENALEHTMTNLTTTSLNLTNAESRIRDADMSKSMMELVKLQILNQSGTSMLSQANQLPQSVLSLLQ